MRRSRAQTSRLLAGTGGAVTQIHRVSYVLLAAGLITLGAGLQLTTGLLGASDSSQPEQNGIARIEATATNAALTVNNDSPLPPAAPLDFALAAAEPGMADWTAVLGPSEAEPAPPMALGASEPAAATATLSPLPVQTDPTATTPAPSVTPVPVPTSIPSPVVSATPAPAPTSTPVPVPTSTVVPSTEAPPTEAPATATPVPATEV